MSLLSLKLPPGLFGNGTLYQAMGRWARAQLIRFYEKTIRPLGGWVELRADAQEGEIVLTNSFLDSFTDTNGTNLTAHAVDMGGSGSWTGTGFEIQNNSVQPASALNTTIYAQHQLAANPTVGQEARFSVRIGLEFGNGTNGSYSSDSRTMWFLMNSTTTERFTLQLGTVNGPFASGNRTCQLTFRQFNASNSEIVSETYNFDLPESSIVDMGVTFLSATTCEVWYETVAEGRVVLDASVTVTDQISTGTHNLMGLSIVVPAAGDDELATIGFAGLAIGTRTALSASITLDGVPRAIVGWRGNDGNQVLAVGTNTHLYAHSVGALTDITPDGFTPGLVDTRYTDASGSTRAYGRGRYGRGLYGRSNPAQQSVTLAAVWHLDTFGQFLVACCAPNDGRLYLWDKNPANKAEDLAVDAPVANRSVVVTPERFIFALGAGGTSRRVEWPSQETTDDWTPSPSNSAGGTDLEGYGNIVAGRRAKGETLIWTDDDLHAARYIGAPFYYSFEKIGAKCGLCAPGAVTVIDTTAFWMGDRQFYMYDGYVKPLPCDVSDQVFLDFNYGQRQKVSCVTTAQFGEVTWFYPSAGSTENDRYVTINYREGHWTTGKIRRTCGTDAGALANPVWGSQFGKLYEHEKGFDRPVAPTEPAVELPYLESGPLEMASGEVITYVSQMIPDERALGDLEFLLYTSFYPCEQEVLRGPFTQRLLTDVRWSGRWVRLRAQQPAVLGENNSPDFRLGIPRLLVTQAGGR